MLCNGRAEPLTAGTSAPTSLCSISRVDRSPSGPGCLRRYSAGSEQCVRGTEGDLRAATEAGTRAALHRERGQGCATGELLPRPQHDSHLPVHASPPHPAPLPGAGPKRGAQSAPPKVAHVQTPLYLCTQEISFLSIRQRTPAASGCLASCNSFVANL